MTANIRCCVPHCTATRQNKPELKEWICGEHWKPLDLPRRRAYGRLVRRWRRFSPAGDDKRAWRLWRALKRMAIDRAMGIS